MLVFVSFFDSNAASSTATWFIELYIFHQLHGNVFILVSSYSLSCGLSTAEVYSQQSAVSEILSSLKNQRLFYSWLLVAKICFSKRG